MLYPNILILISTCLSSFFFVSHETRVAMRKIPSLIYVSFNLFTTWQVRRFPISTTSTRTIKLNRATSNNSTPP
jgi:hypothetical protein